MAYWADNLVQTLEGPQHLNDSKTPSGRIHVGALRGPLVHDLIFRAAGKHGLTVDYTFGCDDYDPLDSIPSYLPREKFVPFLGHPLRNIPSPEEGAISFSGFYIGEFFDTFDRLGIGAKTYFMSDFYRSGRMNEAIDICLHNAAKIREIYQRVSGSERSFDWMPFNVICERCGKIATTQVLSYDGKTVEYICGKDVVDYTQGCGYKGRVSPFDGAGKLPWKLEWTARWDILGVTIEGAGKDHITAGGSREVAAAVLKEVFGKEPPLNVPYEWVLTGQQKMSTSKGIGFFVRDVVDIVPPDLLRFLFASVRPQSAIEFRLDGMAISDVYDKYDVCATAYFDPEKVTRDDVDQLARIFELSQPDPQHICKGHRPRFLHVATLIQLPNLDVHTTISKDLGRELAEDERDEIDYRARFARLWLDELAPENARFEIKQSLPDQTLSLSDAQRQVLDELLQYLQKENQWHGQNIHSEIHRIAKSLNLAAKAAFEAVYIVFLGRSSGPRAGDLLAGLNPDFVLNRLLEVMKTGTKNVN